MQQRRIAIIFILFSFALYLAIDSYSNNSATETTTMPSTTPQSEGSVLPRSIKFTETQKTESSIKEIFKSRGKDNFLEKLDNLTVQGIPGNSENIDELNLLFRTGNDPEEKIRLARLYNTAYFGTEDVLLRKRISKTISDLLRAETNPAVGRALALSHSRLFINEQTKENLEFAYKKNFLSNDDYYGELGHIMPLTMGPVRQQIIKEMAASHNRYASEIVSDFIANSEKFEFSKEEAASLRKYLAESEPTFTGLPSSFGMIDAIRYEQWLKAVVHIENKENSTPQGSIIFNKLTSANADPRAAIALLISPYSKVLLEEEKNRTYMNEIKQKAEKFIAQNPSEPSLQQAGNQITQLFSRK